MDYDSVPGATGWEPASPLQATMRGALLTATKR